MKFYKSSLLFILLFFFSTIGFGQSWVEMMDDTSANFYDIQKSFNKHWEGKKIEKGKGWKQFKRWEHFMAPRVYPSGNMNFQSSLWNEYQILKNNETHKNITETANWQELGPFDVPSSGGGAGRVNCVAFHPTDANIIFVGAPAGGLWKTTNGGTSWTTSTDLLPNLGVSSIIIDPKNSNIMYIATGDADAGDTYSVGVLKSTDGGTTWNSTGLSFTVSQNRRVNKLLIHPVNTDTVYAATSVGIYRSVDAGNIFTLVRSGNYKDLEFKPDDPSFIWACTTNRIWKSINAGTTWTNLTSFVPSNITRTTIAVTSNDPNYLYALTGNDSDNGLGGVYRSTDLGATMPVCSTYPNLLGWSEDGSDSGGQAWYDLALAVSPTNKNTVLVGGVNIWKSTDGGFNWTLNAHWYGGGGAPYVHADIHSIDFYPGSGSTIFTGSDGGLFKTTTTGSSWTDKSDGISIGQIYRIGCSATNPNLVITGWQDNGSNLYTSPNWEQVLGGDGMDCLIDYSNSNYIYGSIYYGDLYRSSDGGNNWNSIKNNISEEGGWITPYVLDPVNPQIIYAGYGNVWKSTNRGNSWTQISNFSSGNKIVSLAVSNVSSNTIYMCTDYNAYVTFNGGTNWSTITYGSGTGTGLPSLVFTGIITSPTNQNVAWISMSGYSAGLKVYKTIDGGATWTNYSGTLPNIPANCLVYENGTNDGVYVGTDLGVFYRDAAMTDWVSFNDNLPNVIIDDLEIQYSSGKLRAATYGRGLWETELFSIVGTKNIEVQNSDLSIYPNPGTGEFTIKLKNSNKINITKVEVFNQFGKPIKTVNTDNNNTEFYFDISNEPAGIYLINIATPTSTISKTFIKTE